MHGTHLTPCCSQHKAPFKPVLSLVFLLWEAPFTYSRHDHVAAGTAACVGSLCSLLVPVDPVIPGATGRQCPVWKTAGWPRRHCLFVSCEQGMSASGVLACVVCYCSHWHMRSLRVQFVSGLLCSGLGRLDHFGLQSVFRGRAVVHPKFLLCCAWQSCALLLRLGQQPWRKGGVYWTSCH